MSKTKSREKLLKQIPTKTNFAKAVKSIRNPNGTNFPSSSKKGIQLLDKDGKGTGKTNLPIHSEILLTFEDEPPSPPTKLGGEKVKRHRT